MDKQLHAVIKTKRRSAGWLNLTHSSLQPPPKKKEIQINKQIILTTMLIFNAYQEIQLPPFNMKYLNLHMNMNKYLYEISQSLITDTNKC